MAQFVAQPRTTFDIVRSQSAEGLANQRTLLVGQMLDGSATAGGLTTGIPGDPNSINALFGAGSHLAMVARGYREVNPITTLDALPLADASGGTAATATIAFSGTATANGSLFVTLVSDENHNYELDLVIGDTAANAVTKLLALIAADINVPFAATGSTGTLTATANNKGLHANDWLLRVSGVVPGITFTLTGWAGGATNPTLTTLFNPVLTVRYQTIIWPAQYTLANVKNFLEARKNVDNQVLDGMAFVYQNAAFGTVMTTAASLNSSEVAILYNEPTSATNWKGPHLPEAPDVLTAKLAAALDLRAQPGADCSSIVSTNAPRDQVGGPHMHSLPCFNTPLIGVGVPMMGTGLTQTEQEELEGAGVGVLGANRTYNAAISGVLVTTYLNDIAGNPDVTWKYVEWRRTHGAIREYMQANCQARFQQSRLTTGQSVSGYSMVSEADIRSYITLLYIQLTQLALTVDGEAARSFFENNLVVTLQPSQRTVQIAMQVPMVSQLGAIVGTVQYTFQTS